MKRPLIIGAFVLMGIDSLQADDSVVAAVPANGTNAPIVDFSQVSKHYHDVLARPQFQETDESRIDSRVEDWLSQWFKRLGAQFGEFKYASHMPAFESLLMTLLVAFSISILLYIMVRLTYRRDGRETEPGPKRADEKTFRSPEFYEDEIRQAVSACDWHAAWLASWRQFLSRLENRQLVEADRTRTNREYLAQLLGKPLPGSAMALLTGMVDAYDQFIYGRKLIAEPDWNHFHQQMGETTLLLHLDVKKVVTKEIGSNS